MKKLLFLILVAALSSCSSNVDRTFDLYLQAEVAKSSGDSLEYIKYKEMFKRSAIILDKTELEKLDHKIKNYISNEKAYQEECKTKSIMIKNMLNEE